MKQNDNQLATQPAQALALTQDPIQAGLASIIAGGVTVDNVEALGKLADIYERMQLKEAEKAFNSAFVALQAALPVIVAKTVIPNRGKYQRFEDVMEEIGPLLKAHGFSVSFSMAATENRVTETCHLRHIGGHSSSNSFSVRTGRADTETQADCKAATTAKRNALLNALNIVIRQDALQGEDDSQNEGEFITHDKVQYLKERLAEVGGNEAAFLAIAGAGNFEEICEGSYPVLIRTIDARAAKKASK